MTTTNKGSQTVFDRYKQQLTGDLQGQSKEEIRKPGVISGMQVTKFDDSTVRIAAGRFNISDGTRTVTIKKDAIYDLTVDGSSEYVVARYTYDTNETWYADFLNVNAAGVLPNDIILAEIVYLTGDVDTVDSDVATNALETLDNNVFVTALGKNKTLKELIETGDLVPGNPRHIDILNIWYEDEMGTAPLEELYNNKVPVNSFDDVSTKYIYMLIKTNVNIDINLKLTFFMDTAASGLARFKLEYLPLANGLDISSIVWNGYTEENLVCPAAANEVSIVETTDLKIPVSETGVEDRFILCRLSRDYAHAQDTHTGKVSIIGIVAVT